MKIWNYISEFFLFRWLFSKLGMYKRGNDAPTNGINDIRGVDNKPHIVNNCVDTDSIHDTITTADDNYNGDYDESNDLDDLDIFMRNNSVREYGNMSRRSVNYSNNHDWDSGNYDRSFDNFHEEQDDYDMMDDF